MLVDAKNWNELAARAWAAVSRLHPELRNDKTEICARIRKPIFAWGRCSASLADHAESTGQRAAKIQDGLASAFTEDGLALRFPAGKEC